MKAIILFCSILFSLPSFALTREEWISVLEKNNVPTTSISFSNNMNTAVCLAFDETTLFRFDVYEGDFELAKDISFKDGQGRFRPEGVSKDEYISFLILDVADFSGSEVYLATSNYNSSVRIENFRNPLTNKSSNPKSTKLPVHKSTINLMNSYYSSTRRVRYFTPKKQYLVRISESPLEVFIHDGNVYLFSHKDTQCHIIDKSGALISSKTLAFEQPLIKSIKGLEVVQDKDNGDIYLMADTNFSFLVYKINEKNEATFVEKINNVWSNPNWVIESGKIYSDNKQVAISK